MLRVVVRRKQGCPVMVEPRSRRITDGQGRTHLPLASSPPPLPPRAQGRRGSTTWACRPYAPNRPHTARFSSRPVRRHQLGRREPLWVATHRRLAPSSARCRRVPAAPPGGRGRAVLRRLTPLSMLHRLHAAPRLTLAPCGAAGTRLHRAPKGASRRCVATRKGSRLPNRCRRTGRELNRAVWGQLGV